MKKTATPISLSGKYSTEGEWNFWKEKIYVVYADNADNADNVDGDDGDGDDEENEDDAKMKDSNTKSIG